MTDQTVTVVTSFPRAGSSLMMRMIDVAGIPPLPEALEMSYEATRLIDPDPGDWAWFTRTAGGRACKLLDLHRVCPPPGLPIAYRWIRLSRNLQEQARSNVKFLQALDQPLPMPAAKLRAALKVDMRRTEGLVSAAIARLGGPVLCVRFEDLILDPAATARRVARFVGCGDPVMMAAIVVDRPATCLPYLLETQLVGEGERVT